MEVSSSYKQSVMGSHQFQESMACCPKTQQQQHRQQQEQMQQERKLRPQPEQALKCPRCDSTNTKFCYYNNYSLSQPRYFCKGCRRYWTQGGSLRNVPVGGGCRKNKRPSCSTSSSTTSSSYTSKTPHDPPLLLTNSNPLLSATPLPPPRPPPPLSYDPSDLTLAFASLHTPPTAPTGQLGSDHDHHHDHFLLGNLNPSHHMNPGFLETNNPSILQNLYYGFNSDGGGRVREMEGGGDHDEVAMPPFDGGLGGATATSSAATTPATSQGLYKNMDVDHESKTMMGGLHQWHNYVGGDHGSMGLDLERDYWNGVASSWHSLINSSLM